MSTTARPPMTADQLVSINGVLDEVFDERRRQHSLWGEQDHPDGTRAGGMNLVQREQAKASCDRATREGRVTFAHILAEEFWEAMCEEDPGRLRIEILQVAAVCVQWAEAIDRRGGA